MKDKNKNIILDYQSFLNGPPQNPPFEIQQQLFKKVDQDLNPPTLKLSIKFAAIQIFGILFSLLLCPQFGFGPFGGESGLMSLYMLAGSYACAIFCGATFLGVSSFLSSLILTMDETRNVIRKKIIYVPFLLSAAFALLMTLNGEETLVNSTLWVIGAGISYRIFLNFGRALKLNAHRGLGF